jgi:hypothetical protein
MLIRLLIYCVQVSECVDWNQLAYKAQWRLLRMLE